jgi:uncharacterized protein involved in tellurium resistance
MKNQKNERKLMQVQHVYSKNNQVYLKKSTRNLSGEDKLDNEIEWWPINFQWKPIIDLQNELKLKL